MRPSSFGVMLTVSAAVAVSAALRFISMNNAARFALPERKRLGKGHHATRWTDRFFSTHIKLISIGRRSWVETIFDCFSGQPMNPQAAWLVQRLGLTPHPEGGYYRETYRSSLPVQSPAHATSRAAFTSIHFLLADGQYSAWHRVTSDEGWFFHLGCDLEIYSLCPSLGPGPCVLTVDTLGASRGQFEVTIPAGRWFAAKPVQPEGFALVSCVVGPGFEFEDFQLASRQDLLATGLQDHADWALIESLMVRPVT